MVGFRVGTCLVVIVALSLIAAPVILAFPVPGVAQSIAYNPETNKIYVSDGAASVHVVDGLTARARKTVPLSSPQGIAANPTTNRIYVGVSGGLAVINGNGDNLVATIPLRSSSGRQVAVDPVMNVVFATYDSHNLAIIDAEKSRFVTRIRLPWCCSGEIAVNPNTHKAYVATSMYSRRAPDAVHVIDGQTRTLLKSIDVGADRKGLSGVAVNPVTNRVYVLVNSGDEGQVVEIDGVTDSIVRSTPVPRRPRDVAVDSSHNRLFISHPRERALSEVTDGGPPQVHKVGYYATSLEFDPAGGRVLVGSNLPNVTFFYRNEILRNPNFEFDDTEDGIPDRWRGKQLGADDRLVGYYPYPDGPVFDGRVSFQVHGAGGIEKRLQQAVPLQGTLGTMFHLEAFSKSTDASPGGAYQARVRVLYTDGTSDTVGVNFASGTHDWQRKAKTFSATKDFEALEFILVYDNQTGTVWFDGIHLGMD